MGLSAEWSARLPVLPSWIQMVLLGVFTVAGAGYLSPGPVTLREGINKVSSWPDKISMGMVLVSSTSLLCAPIVWTLVQPTWMTVPVLFTAALTVLHVRYMGQIRDLPLPASRLLFGLPILVILDSMLGMPKVLLSLTLLTTVASMLSMIVTLTSDADNKRSRFYHHRNFLVAIHSARWMLRAVSVAGVIHVVQLIRPLFGNMSHVIVVIAISAVGLAVVALTLGFFNVKIPLFRKER